MKAVKIIARGQPAFVDAPKPELRPGTGLVRSLRLSLCGSDIRHLHHLGDEFYPTAAGETGHEMVGVVEAIDPASASDVQVGDRVLCLAPDHRAMCEYYVAPVDRLLRLDPATPLEHSVQAQQFGTVLYAARVLPDLHGKNVAVIGQGSAGLWFNFTLRQRGASKIIALDLKAYRLAYSKRFGATHTIHNAESPVAALREICGGELPDVVIDAAGEAEAIRLAVEIARPNGFVLLFGVPRFDLMDGFPIFDAFWKTLTLRGMVGTINDPGHACTRQALDYINSGAVDVGRMITHSFKFADVFEAYELHRIQDEGAVKIVIDMEG